ncbi:MAG: DUF4250 domain-containing protein [Clostridia bacterium]|nr:DUF4250 domain-containing protein [Clostridia bacterium]
MNLPSDVFMMMSVINTELRDKYPSLDEFCKAENLSRAEIEEKLAVAGFEYNAELNKFW